MTQIVDDEIEEQTSFVIAELQRLAVVIDQLWRDALDAGLSDTEISLREASQAVYRAVITLSSQKAARWSAPGFTVEWE
jgi:hypothetical protein